MKRLIFALLLLSAFSSLCSADQLDFSLPERLGTVSDYANVVDPPAAEKAGAMADELRRATSVNFSVLVVNQLPPGTRIKDFAAQVYDKWGVGGILLVLSILDGDVKLVTDKGAERLIPRRSLDQAERDVRSLLVNGMPAKAVEIGAIEVSNQGLADWYASRKPISFSVDRGAASVMMFTLCLAAVVMTLVVGGDFMMGFNIFIGGLFGFTYLNLTGLIVFAALGFGLAYKSLGMRPAEEAGEIVLQEKKHEKRH